MISLTDALWSEIQKWSTDCDYACDTLSEADSEFEADCDSEIVHSLTLIELGTDCDSETEIWSGFRIRLDCDSLTDTYFLKADSEFETDCDSETDALSDGFWDLRQTVILRWFTWLVRS